MPSFADDYGPIEIRTGAPRASVALTLPSRQQRRRSVTTPRIPGVVFNVELEQTTQDFSIDDEIVYLVGVGGSSDNGGQAADNDAFVVDAAPTALNSEAEARALIGDNGSLYRACAAIFSQVRTTVYVGRTAGTSHALINAALDHVRDLPDTPAIIGAPGLTAGADGSPGANNSSAANAVAQHLEELAEEIDCLAVADGPFRDGTTPTDAGDIDDAIVWIANNADARIMPLVNPVLAGHTAAGEEVLVGGRFYEDLSGHWIGAVEHRAAEDGRQRGIDYAPITTASGTLWQPSYSPSDSVDSQVRQIIRAFGSVAILRHGDVQILGDTMNGDGGIEDIWSVRDVLDHLDRILFLESEQWQSRDGQPETLQRAANALERAGRIIVGPGEELAGLVIVPSGPDRNSDEARARREAHFETHPTLRVPLATITHHIVLRT